ncbi:hypothetical protein AB0F13_17520 [Streptomyces sp. NPDC026206]|uniref:hypothetical protein n=1 Tax=Streptomyces sp. NPDC026206 TaxID=3157089 RepID=UPI0033CFAA02
MRAAAREPGFRRPRLSAGFRRRLVAEPAEPGPAGPGVHFAGVVFCRGSREGDGPA